MKIANRTTVRIVLWLVMLFLLVLNFGALMLIVEVLWYFFVHVLFHGRQEITLLVAPGVRTCAVAGSLRGFHSRRGEVVTT